jgi:hypothetical protein
LDIASGLKKGTKNIVRPANVLVLYENKTRILFSDWWDSLVHRKKIGFVIQGVKGETKFSDI